MTATQPSAMIAPCDDCGNITATLNCNTISIPYMLCGKCQYAHLGDIDAGQEWNSSDGKIGLTMLNDRVWMMEYGHTVVTVPAAHMAELMIALQVAQARQEAAQQRGK